MANESQFSSVGKELLLIYSNRTAGASTVYGVSVDIKHLMKTLLKLWEHQRLVQTWAWAEGLPEVFQKMFWRK